MREDWRNAGFISQLTFSWVSRVIAIAFERELELKVGLPPFFTCRVIDTRLSTTTFSDAVLQLVFLHFSHHPHISVPFLAVRPLSSLSGAVAY